MQRHQSLTDVGVRRRIKLSALSITEKIIQGIKGTFAVKLGGSLVAHVVAPTTKWLVVHRTAKGRPMVLIVAARMSTGRVRRLTKGSRVSTELAIVIVITRRS